MIRRLLCKLLGHEYAEPSLVGEHYPGINNYRCDCERCGKMFGFWRYEPGVEETE